MNPVLEDMILLALGLFVLGQIVVPMIRERPLFPVFRPKWDADYRLKVARLKHAEAEAKLEVAKLNASTSQLQLDAAKIEAKSDAKVATTQASKKKESEQ